MGTERGKLRFENPRGLYDPTDNGFSHVAVVPPGAALVYVAGQGGEDAQGRLPPEFTAQVRQAFGNLRIALESVGGRYQDVAKLTVLVVDHDETRLGELTSEMRAIWADGSLPTCTLVPVQRLALAGMLFEVEAVAAIAAGS